MIGTTIIANDQHARYAGGPSRAFDRHDVIAFGRHARRGDSVTRYQVRLRDGTELMVKASEQPAAERAWLRALAQMTPHPVTSRDIPFADTWITVTGSPPLEAP